MTSTTSHSTHESSTDLTRQRVSSFFTLFAAVVVTSFSLVSFAARADHAGPDYTDLAVRLKQAREACAPEGIDCRQAGLRSIQLYTHQTQPAALDPATLETFSAVAKKQAQIWADTILEGDYAAAGNTRLDRVEAVYEKVQDQEKLVAYRILYSEKAWYVADCDPRKSKESCESGRIVEASFVSPSATSWMRDDTAYADFSSDQSAL